MMQPGRGLTLRVQSDSETTSVSACEFYDGRSRVTTQPPAGTQTWAYLARPFAEEIDQIVELHHDRHRSFGSSDWALRLGDTHLNGMTAISALNYHGGANHVIRVRTVTGHPSAIFAEGVMSDLRRSADEHAIALYLNAVERTLFPMFNLRDAIAMLSDRDDLRGGTPEFQGALYSAVADIGDRITAIEEMFHDHRRDCGPACAAEGAPSAPSVGGAKDALGVMAVLDDLRRGSRKHANAAPMRQSFTTHHPHSCDNAACIYEARRKT